MPGLDSQKLLKMQSVHIFEQNSDTKKVVPQLHQSVFQKELLINYQLNETLS